MNYFEKILLHYLWDGQIEMQITGFDTAGFQKAIREESKRRLELIEQIVFEDNDIISDTLKVEAIQKLFQQEFYYKE